MSTGFFRYLDTFVERLHDVAGDVRALPALPGRERSSGEDAIRPLSANAERALVEMVAGLREIRFAETSASIDADDCRRIFSYLVNAAAGAVAAADAEIPLDDPAHLRASGMQPRLELLSGCVFAGGKPVEVPPRELAVLTYLAICGRPAGRDAITDAVWPEHDPDVAAKNLKVIVHRARRRLGETVIESSRDGYVLGATVFVDLRDAESLVRAAAAESAFPGAYARPLQALVRSCRSRDRAALMRYDWYVALDRRLRELERDAVLQLCRRANAAGDAATVLALSSDLLAIDPADELACEFSVTARLSIPDFTGARRDLRAFAAAVRAAGDEVALKRLEKTFARMLDRIDGAIARAEGSTF